MRRASRSARSTSPSIRACCGSPPASRWPPPCCSRTSRACRLLTRLPASAWRAAASASRRARTGVCGLRDDPDCVLVRAARRRGHAARHARRAADGEHRLRHAARAGLRHADVGAGRRHRRSEGHQLVSGSDAAHRPGARRGRRRGRKLRAVARCGQLRSGRAIHRRGLYAGERRRESARTFSHRRASLLRRARHPDRRRPRLHRRGPRWRRTGGDRQPERRAAAVPERRRREPEDVVDRSVLWQQATAAPHRRRGGGRGRRKRGAQTGADDLSPRPADRRGRPAVRARIGRSVRARAGGDARRPPDFRGSAAGARRDARGRARGSAVAQSGERVRVLRIRRHRAADRRRRRGGRAGVLGQRAHARVRRAAGGRIRAAPTGDPRALGRAW